MKVKVNDIEIHLFKGAKVIDAVRIYYLEKEKPLPYKIPLIKDAFGNNVAEDGSLSENSKLFIYEKKKSFLTYLNAIIKKMKS